jgi:hypothetical protein
MDAAPIEQFSLEQTYDINGKSWHVGCWMHDEPFLNELLCSNHVYVVHDPQEGFVSSGTDQYAKGTAIIFSFGHKLISKWAKIRTGFPPVFPVGTRPSRTRKVERKLKEAKEMCDSKAVESLPSNFPNARIRLVGHQRVFVAS